MRWLWVLEKQDIVYNGQVVPLGTNWDEWMQSLMAYPFNPPVLARSAEGQHDEDKNPVIGHVIEWKVLKHEEALAIGVASRGEEALYCKVKPVEGQEEACNAITYVSPSIVPNFIDEVGNEWDFVISHVAEVSVPFQQLTQPDQKTLVGLALSRQMAKNVNLQVEEEVVDAVEEVLDGVDEVAEEAADQALNLTELIGMVIEEVAALRGEIMIIKGEAPEAEGVAEGEMVPMSSLPAAVARELQVQRRADDILETRVWNGTREELVNLCRVPAQHVALKKSLAAKRAEAPRVGAQQAKGGNAMNFSKMTDGEAARFIAKRDGINFSAALKKVADIRGGK